MSSLPESCLHLDLSRASGAAVFVCPTCGAKLDDAGISRWVKEAERERDEAHPVVEGDEFGEIVREERQQEVYRRRKLMYELRSAPRVETARPEMLLVTHEVESGTYECRIFYKEPRPEHVMDRFSVEASIRAMLELKSDPSPLIRTAATKVEEFHLLRARLAEDGEAAPGRRVFYANEL